jgi:plasmid stabilization system protein ParE
MEGKILFVPEVVQDLDEAYSYYEGCRVGLGEDFLTYVDACLQAIARTPEMHQRIFENYRRGLVRRFPYAVFYEVAEGIVTVHAVLHTSRNPEKWRSRLRPEG